MTRVTDDFSRALVVLAEALVSEKRVLVVGDSSLGLHAVLSELGARIVHVFDPDSARALAQTPPTDRGTVLRGLPEGDFEVRDGAFDLAVVPDISAVPDSAALLARLRRVVGTEGAVMCAARNADALGGQAGEGDIGYYELFDLVSLQFAHVRMIAVMPFFGVTLAELGQDEVDAAVRVDTQLAGDRPPPAAFVALASQRDVAVDAYAVIELASPPERVAVAPLEISAELAQARLRAEYLEAQVEELATMRVARTRAEEEARRVLEALEVERARALRLERDVDALSSAKLKVHAAPDPDLAEQLAQAQLRAAALEEGIELAEKTIIVQRERIADVEAALADAEAPKPPEGSQDDEQAEVAALEGKLKERGEVVASLEVELARREKIVRELVARVETEMPEQDSLNGGLAKKLDDLALLAARQKSDLEARAWRISELERALSEGTSQDPGAGPG